MWADGVLGCEAAASVAGLLRAGYRSGDLLGGSRLRSLGSLGWYLVCGSRQWGGCSVAWRIFGLQGFSFRQYLKTKQSATPYVLLFKIGLSRLYVNNGA